MPTNPGRCKCGKFVSAHMLICSCGNPIRSEAFPQSQTKECLLIAADRDARVRVVGNPTSYEKEFQGKKYTRYKIPVVDLREEKEKLLDCPTSVLREILAAIDAVAPRPLESLIFRLRKSGYGLSARYEVHAESNW